MISISKFKKDLIINVLDYLISFFLILITTKLIVSNLGELNYGLYSALGIIISSSMLVEGGISLSVNHYAILFLSNNQFNDFSKLIGSSVNLYLVISVSVFLGFYFYSEEIIRFLSNKDNINRDIEFLVFLIPFVIFSNLMINPFSSYLIATESWKEASVINITIKFINIILLYLIIDNSFETLYKILLIMIMLNFFKIILLYLIMKKNGYSLNYNIEFFYLKKILSYTKYSSLQFFSALSIFYLDKFYIKANFSLIEIGYFNFAFLVGNYIHGFYGNVYRTLFPKFVSNKNSISLLLKSLIIFFSASLLITTIIYILWIPLLGSILTTDFALKTYSYISLVLILVNIRVFEISFHYFFHGIGKPKIMGISSLLLASMLAMSYEYFIVQFGKTGTLLAQITFFSVTYFVLFIYTFKIFKINEVMNGGR